MNNNTPEQPPALPTQHKRILATSVKGDSVWELSAPVLQWMQEHGDEELSQKAYLTLLGWEMNQGWFIEWGNKTRYFELAELACRDLAQFKQMYTMAPAGHENTQRIIDLALMVGEMYNKPIGNGRKNILLQNKKQRRGRRRHV